MKTRGGQSGSKGELIKKAGSETGTAFLLDCRRRKGERKESTSRGNVMGAAGGTRSRGRTLGKGGSALSFIFAQVEGGSRGKQKS